MVKQDQTSQSLWNACEALRGSTSVDIYKDFALTMLFLKYISDVSQKNCDTDKSECFAVPDGASFDDLYKLRHEPGNGERIDKALNAIEKANVTKLKGEDKSLFQDIKFDTDRLGDRKQRDYTLIGLLEVFAQYEGLDHQSSKTAYFPFGNTYEYLIKKFAVSGGYRAGEIYTPPEVSELMAKLLRPAPGESICDPACGSGSLLIRCGQEVVINHRDAEYSLFGQEVLSSNWSLCRMNMFIHREYNHQIEWGDTIRAPKLVDQNGRLNKFDIVISNPPFGSDKWGYEEAQHDKFDRFHWGMPPKAKGDYAFISHMIETMKPETGRMAVIVSHGVLFRGGSEGEIRERLIEENLLDAVIGLPDKLFYGTGIPAAILIFRSDRHSRNTGSPKVTFIDASREFKAGRSQNQLTPESIDKIVGAYSSGESLEGYANVVSLEEIRANDYNLNIPRYVDSYEGKEKIDLKAVGMEYLETKAKLTDLEVEMSDYMRALGYDA